MVTGPFEAIWLHLRTIVAITSAYCVASWAGQGELRRITLLRGWVNKGKRKRPLSPPSLPLRLQTRNLAPTLMSGLSHYFNGEVTVARGTETRHERLALGSPLVYFEARRGT